MGQEEEKRLFYSIIFTHPDHGVLKATHHDRPVGSGNDPVSRPKHKGECLDIGWHIQLRNLQHQANHED